MALQQSDLSSGDAPPLVPSSHGPSVSGDHPPPACPGCDPSAADAHPDVCALASNTIRSGSLRDPLVETVATDDDGDMNDVNLRVGLDGSSGSCDVPFDVQSDSPPPCSMFDPSTVDRPISPDLVCDFPLNLKQDAEFDSLLAELPQMPSLLDSVVHVVDRPRVLGIGVGQDGSSYARLTPAPTTMVDGGSNICLTNVLSHLLDVVQIAPVPVSVAIEDGSSESGYVCTAKGLLPLRFDDGTIHYQPTFYCANAVETIISPQAILNSSDIFASWQQTGYKDGLPGLLHVSAAMMGCARCPFGSTTSTASTTAPLMRSRSTLLPLFASSHAWIFLFKSKEPPLETLDHFMTAFKRKDGGFIRTDQGGELAGCDAFVDQMLANHGYKVEPTGADSPSQNGGAEKWNDSFAVSVRALLYGAGMPAKYWSAALLHACYLHNRRVHQRTNKTPFEAWNGQRPDLTHLKLFGSCVCVKQTGDRRAKLDRHDFTGLFLGYTATDHNIRYLDIDSGLVKSCHHATFDEAWYLQPVRPPAAQMLYDLGLEDEAPDFL
ncbi:hypothetical protein ACHAWF_009220 [Thalassiosira exigua]